MIIVADDEPLVRMVAADALVDAGFEVVEAGNAAEAIALLEAHAGLVDGLFTDVHMPGAMNGVALAHHIRNANPSIAVVVASGRPLDDDAALPERGRFMRKPYDIDRVAAQLRELISAAP